MSHQLDGQRRERDFHAATHALDWHRAEQLTVAALQDRDLTDAERDAWRERRAAARRTKRLLSTCKTGGRFRNPPVGKIIPTRF